MAATGQSEGPLAGHLPLILLGVLIAIVGGLNLALSLRQGSLAMPPIYDDVGYLLDAYSRLTLEQVNTLRSVVASLYHSPPHAPLSTLTAMLGFSLFGPSIFSAYAMNIWGLALYGFAIYLVARRHVSALVSLLVAAFMLFAPAPHLIMSEFRPDIISGVIFAIAIYALIFAEYDSVGTSVTVGILAALAIMAKPTAFVATVPLIGASAVIGVLRPFECRGPDRARHFKYAATGVAAAFVVLLPFAVIWGPSVVHYTYDALVTRRDLWVTPGDRWFHGTFYSTGPGGTILLGWFFLVGAAAILADIALSARNFRNSRASYNAVGYYLILPVIYLGLAFTSEKTVYQGSFFALPWLLATGHAIARLLARMNRTWRAATSLSGLLLCGFLASPLSQHQDSRTWPEATEIRNAILAAIDRVPNRCSRPRWIATLAPYPVTAEAIVLEQMMRGGERLIPRQLFFSPTLAEMMAGANASDLVLVPNRFGATYQSNLPGLKFVDETDALLSRDPAWQRLPLRDLIDPPKLYYKACR